MVLLCYYVRVSNDAPNDRTSYAKGDHRNRHLGHL